MNEVCFETKIPVWNQIVELVEPIAGWAPIDQIFALYNLAIATRNVEGDLLEVGSWCGRTSVVLGKAAAATDTKLYCVDLFPEREDWHQNSDGSYSMKVDIAGEEKQGYSDQTVWKEPFETDIEPVYQKFGSILDVFRENIENTRVDKHVEYFKDDSTVLRRKKLGPFRLAFLDGDHGYDAVMKDIEIVAERLTVGGWICFDDAFSSYEGVNAAIADGILGNPDFDHGYQVTRKCFVAQKVR